MRDGCQGAIQAEIGPVLQARGTRLLGAYRNFSLEVNHPTH